MTTKTNQNHISLPILLTQAQLAQYTGVSEKTLERDRFLRRGIPYVKVGRLVRYRITDVERHLAANTVATDQK